MAATPPRPIARPIEEARGHADSTARCRTLAYDEADAERADHGHAGEEEGDDANWAADEHVGRDQRRRDDEAPEQDATAADPVGERPAEKRPDRAGEEEEREQPRPVDGALAARDLVERDEGEEAHMREAP